MITIPSGELTGILSDVVPFACPDKELPDVCCVRLDWDGELLTALATDRYQIGQSSWCPDDDPDGEAQDDLFTTWGGTDDPWRIVLDLDDAKDLVTVFKLPLKENRAPLTVDVADGQITVRRHRDTGHSALTAVMQGTLHAIPDLVEQLLNESPVAKVEQIVYDAKRLAGFAKVRQRGPLVMQFAGEHKPIHVTIGTRFTGAIMPVRIGNDVDAAHS